MLGLMQDRPLLVSSLIEFAALYHGDREIVTRTLEGPIHRYGYRECHSRAKKAAKALLGLGFTFGDRVGTLAWNTYRHMEIWYASSGIGGVCHTINPRLFEDQIVYIANHAEDRFLFLDPTFLPVVEPVADRLSSVRHYVIMCAAADMPETSLPNAHCYEELLAAETDDLAWPSFDERTAAGLCYTSGTTGNPKGVLYAHRSNVLLAYGANMPDALGLAAADSVLPVVPMYHANAWALPYCAPMVGAKLVFPGNRMDGESILDLLETEEVTFTAAVPTVWLMLLRHLEETGKTLTHLKRVVIGGSAAPRSMIETFERKYGVEVRHAWGMTEMSPLGTVGALKPGMESCDYKDQLDVKAKQGRAIFGVDLRIVDDEGNELPRDGKAFGHLQVRGPWIVRDYFKGEGGRILDDEDWFDTGDVSTLDPDGYMQITDRSKDVIKSGGEWISSIDLENLAVGHPGVAEAAVIGIAHPKWDERPLLIVVRAEASAVTAGEILDYMRDKIARWWLPDDVVFVDEIPHTATGKIQKITLREQFKDYVLPTARAAE